MGMRVFRYGFTEYLGARAATGAIKEGELTGPRNDRWPRLPGLVLRVSFTLRAAVGGMTDFVVAGACSDEMRGT